MSAIEKTISVLNGYAKGMAADANRDRRPLLLTTFLFLVAVLGVPIYDPGRLVWFFCFPIILAETSSLSYARIFLKSLWLLPVIAIVGIFNPIIDKTPLWQIGDVTISRGWVSFCSIILRGLLTVQALLILAGICGFRGICRALQNLGLPSVLVTQLWMLYRYITVLLAEVLVMQRAREARGYGKKSYPMKMWGAFVGQLLLRSMDRARRVHSAMMARGFTGKMVFLHPSQKPTIYDIALPIVWGLIFFLLYRYDLSQILGNLLQNLHS